MTTQKCKQLQNVLKLSNYISRIVVKLRKYNTKTDNSRDRVEVEILIDSEVCTLK